MISKHDRRTAHLVAGTAALTAAGSLSSFKVGKEETYALKGNINHSVCRWCYSKMGLDDLCSAAKQMGIKAIDLVGPKDWLYYKSMAWNQLCAMGPK